MPEYSTRQVAIVANPFSGSRRNPQRVAALEEALRSVDLEPVVMWGRDDLRDASKERGFAERFRCIVAAGGDGTLHKVVNTTLAAPIAHYPLGTENLFAGHLNYPQDPADMAAAIARGKTQLLDVGKVDFCQTDHPACRFTIVASAGFDAEVVRRLDRWRTRRTDKLRRVRRATYLRPILGSAFAYRFPQMELSADGRVLRGSLCMVFNLPRYGMGLPLAPGAVGDDGFLDYLVFERPGAAALMGYALSVKRGRHTQRADVHTGRAKSIRITPLDAPAPFELDGEQAHFAPVELTIEPAAMRVIAP